MKLLVFSMLTLATLSAFAQGTRTLSSGTVQVGTSVSSQFATIEISGNAAKALFETSSSPTMGDDTTVKDTSVIQTTVKMLGKGTPTLCTKATTTVGGDASTATIAYSCTMIIALSDTATGS